MAGNDPISFHTERWLPIAGYEGLYEVSDFGRVRSLDHSRPASRNSNIRTTWHGRVLIGGSRYGYRIVGLCKNGKTTTRPVHRLVLAAFVGPRGSSVYCNHIDLNRANNRLENLEWCTPKQNSQHAMNLGRMPRGEGHGMASVFTEEKVRAARAMALDGMTTRAIGIALGIKECTVGSVLRGVKWKHVA
jgi:hypothetical protein